MIYIFKKLQKDPFRTFTVGQTRQNLKISTFEHRADSFLKKSLTKNYPRNRESSLARTMEKNLPNKIRKSPKEKQSWRSENCQINYNIRTPKASFGLKMRLTKSTKTGLFQIITDFPKNITE